MRIQKYETNYKRKFYLNETKVKAKKYWKILESQILNVYSDIEYQDVIGFGGALTDATAISFYKLKEEKRKELLNEYFGEDGSRYNIIRLPIGSSDFSEKSYSYVSKKDLSDFSIDKDKKYRIPMIKEILKINPNIKFLSSPWSPPKFMKLNKMYVLGGRLLNKYKQLYAEYIVKYIKAYKEEGINIEFITVQNEPNAIQVWESCIFTSKEEKDFVIKYLYPAFKENNINTKILIWDHNKEKIYSRAKEELSSKEAYEAIYGIGFHYYSGDHFENLRLIRDMYPDKLLIHTEGCTGFSNYNPNDEEKNGELYAHEIIGDFSNGTNAYLDWNMILDHKGGPNHKGNFCNSPVMLNENEDDYIKNMTFYYIRHFSRFIKRGAKRVASSKYSDTIEMCAFKNPDGTLIVVLMNKHGYSKEYTLCVDDKFKVHDNLDSHAIVTYVIKKS